MKTILVTGFNGFIGSNLIPELQKRFYVVGIDYSKTALEYAKNTTKELDNVVLKQSEMDDIPFENSYFDAIISIHTIISTVISL